MKYNIEESFTMVKNDKTRLKKLSIASGIAIVSILLLIVPPIMAIAARMFNLAVFIEIGICWLIAGLLSLMLSGYCLKACHERIFSRDALLPEWNDLSVFLFLGFKSALGSLMFYLPVIAIGLIAGAYDAVSKSTGTPSSSDLGAMGASFIVNTIYNILYFVFWFFYFAFNANFLKDFNIFSYLNYAAAYRRIKGNFVQYAVLVALILALGFIFNIAALILCLTIIGIILLPVVTIYVQLITLDFTAQFIRITENKQ